MTCSGVSLAMGGSTPKALASILFASASFDGG